MNILWRGATGPMVKGLQKSLAKQGAGPVKVDGLFGPDTEIAVKSFQKAHGLAPDGLAGPATLARLGLFTPVMLQGLKAPGVGRPRAAIRAGARAPARRESPLAVRVETGAAPVPAAAAAGPRTLVFVSYSHADAKWLKRLRVFLAPLKRQGMVDEWDDTRIQPGMKWREEIATSIGAARAAVLLLSADFCASDFIAKNELPPLLQAADQGKSTILCVVVSPCDPGPLAGYQFLNPPDKTLAEMEPAKRERVWLKLVESVTTALNH
jgi:hypothetical protein